MVEDAPVPASGQVMFDSPLPTDSVALPLVTLQTLVTGIEAPGTQTTGDWQLTTTGTAQLTGGVGDGDGEGVGEVVLLGGGDGDGEGVGGGGDRGPMSWTGQQRVPDFAGLSVMVALRRWPEIASLSRVSHGAALLKQKSFPIAEALLR